MTGLLILAVAKALMHEQTAPYRGVCRKLNTQYAFQRVLCRFVELHVAAGQHKNAVALFDEQLAFVQYYCRSLYV